MQQIEGGLKVFLFCSFHLAKLFRQQPVAVIVLSVSALVASLTLGAMLFWSARHQELSGALVSLQRSSPAQVTIQPAVPRDGAVDLPEFSSAAFVAQLNSLAHDMGLASEEVTYTLENNPGQPYWRYRINFEVKSGYPQIRKFLAALSSEVPNATLDAIRCQRADTATPALTCNLTLSAFFRTAHG